MKSDPFKALLFVAGLVLAPAARASVPTPAVVPSLDCRSATTSRVEELVCKDERLASLDSKLARVLVDAQAKAVKERPPLLRASQRRWIRERNDCWKKKAQRECVEQSYRLRIAELQARYRLVPGNGPISYRCDGMRNGTVVVTFFRTEPPTLIARRGEQTSLMFIQASASGSKYQSQNESLWEHQGEATIVWGRSSSPMRCQPGS
ncbi:MliC family protein [Accumulibacter sp.]|uniref:MliC family protein n=1 Tax=Accumulibacter sp. TaxID=2053492 RepID=UPI0026111098|nr:MliC family protein [Accumulibacter sp.]